MTSLEGWKILRDRSACKRPGCPLATEKSYYAVLEFPDCVRRDLCEPCFREVERQSDKPLVFWRGRRRDDGKRETVLDLAALRMLFDRLGEEEGERPAALRYFVTLLLLRKRVLRLVDPRNEAEEAADLLVVDPKVEGMEPVALHAPDIDEEDFGGMKDELTAAVEAVDDPE